MTGGEESGDQFHGGRFARAIRTEKPQHLAFLHSKSEVIDSGKLVEFFC